MPTARAELLAAFAKMDARDRQQRSVIDYSDYVPPKVYGSLAPGESLAPLEPRAVLENVDNERRFAVNLFMFALGVLTLAILEYWSTP